MMIFYSAIWHVSVCVCVLALPEDSFAMHLFALRDASQH